ncbi:unnamed protein product [Cunninghamella echinulata]
MSSASMQLSSSSHISTNDSKIMDSNISNSYSLSDPPLLIDISDEPIQSQSTKLFESNSSAPTPGTPQSTLSSINEISQKNMDENDTTQSSSSTTQTKKASKPKKFFSSFSIRRKSKSSSKNNKQSFENSIPIPELPESTSMYSGRAKSFTDETNTYDHDTKSITTTTATTNSNSAIETPNHYQQHHQQYQQPKTMTSSMSLHVPQLRKASSFTDTFFNRPPLPPSASSLSPQSKATILIDDEGFSIPPPDRSPWSTIVNNNQSQSGDDETNLQDTDNDLTSLESGSLNGISPSIIKLDIKNDSVVQEDAKSSQIALTRVASMLKEKNTTTVKRPRGRRELRSQYFGNNNSTNTTTGSSIMDINGTSYSSYHTATAGSIPSSPLSLSTTATTIDEISEDKLNDGNKNITMSPTSYDSPFTHEDDHPVTTSSTTTIDHSSTLTKEIEEEKIISDFNQGLKMNQTSSPISSVSSSPPIKLRITETIHAHIVNGEVVQRKLVGEIAILYEGPRHNVQTPIYFILKQDDLQVATLEKYIIAKGKSKKNKNGMKYQITPNLIQELDYVTCIKYQLSQQPSDKVIPWMVKPMWKCDDDQARLMIKYYKNSICNTLPSSSTSTSTSTSSTTLSLNNNNNNNNNNNINLGQLVMSTQVSRDCTNVQSMPTGEWMIDQQKIMWSLEKEIDEKYDGKEQMIRARFSTKYQSTPQPIHIRFLLKDQLLSSLEIITNPILDSNDNNGLWAKIVHIDKNTRSGKYIAE